MDPRLRFRIDLLVFLVSVLLGLVAVAVLLAFGAFGVGFGAVVGLLLANLAYAVVDRQTPSSRAT